MDLQMWHLIVLGVALAAIITLLIWMIVLQTRLLNRAILAGKSGRNNSRGDNRVAVVFNPTKFSDTTVLFRTINRISAECGMGTPTWYETTERDPGYGQALQAVQSGAEVVLAAGGDGTVRAVADALCNKKVALGLVPGGTGNILARNLDLPVNNLEMAVQIALTGTSRSIDVGRVHIEEQHPPKNGHIFLVMMGFGFDAAIMMDTDEGVKKRLGFLAYYAAAARHLHGRNASVKIAVDGGTPEPRKVRSVMVGNVGRLLGGLNLMPDAEIDDGQLDAIALSPRGLTGWGAVGAELAVPNARGVGAVKRYSGQRIEVKAEHPLPLQIDGDSEGETARFRAVVDKGALLVRVPKDARHRAQIRGQQIKELTGIAGVGGKRVREEQGVPEPTQDGTGHSAKDPNVHPPEK